MGLLSAALMGSGVCAAGQNARVISLEEIFQSAETGSAQLRPALAAEEEARHKISVARSERLPDINASLSISYIGDGFTTARNFSDRQKAPIPHFGNGVGISITQPLYAGGAITNAIDIARLKSTASRFATDFRRDNIRFRLAGFYLDIYKYSNLRDVVEKNINRAKQVLEEMQIRFEQGVSLQNDITRYELLLSNLELQMTRICNMLDILNHNLVVSAGLPADTKVIPDPAILDNSMAPESESWWQREASANAPALLLARNSVEINRRGEAIARSGRLPKVGLQAGWTMDGPILVEVPPINRNLSYWYVGIGVSYNISSLFKTDHSEIVGRAARHRRERGAGIARRLHSLPRSLRGAEDTAQKRGTCRT